jgi:hypothetical protein
MFRFIKLINNRYRAVSPVIAAILLIGLAVLAGAAVFFIVIPLLTPTTTQANITMSALEISGSVSSGKDNVTLSYFKFSISNAGGAAVTVSIVSIAFTNATDSTDALTTFSASIVNGATLSGSPPAVTVGAGSGVNVQVSGTILQTTGEKLGGTMWMKIIVNLGSPINVNSVTYEFNVNSGSLTF